MTDLELGWVTGVFEGEGSVVVQHNSLRLNMRSTDCDVIERMTSLMGGRTYGPYEPNSSLGLKPYWMWVVVGEPAEAGLAAMYPLLSQRRRGQADECRRRIAQIWSAWREPRTCENCGTSFVAKNPRYATRMRYCGDRCRAAYLTRRYRAKLRSTDS